MHTHNNIIVIKIEKEEKKIAVHEKVIKNRIEVSEMEI